MIQDSSRGCCWKGDISCQGMKKGVRVFVLVSMDVKLARDSGALQKELGTGLK